MKAEFFILGALHRGDLHPYEIKRRLSNALVECYTDVDVGTLYYAVRQLVRSGDIAPKTRQKVARGRTGWAARRWPGSEPERGVATVVGLGYEQDKALGAVEHVQAG